MKNMHRSLTALLTAVVFSSVSLAAGFDPVQFESEQQLRDSFSLWDLTTDTLNNKYFFGFQGSLLKTGRRLPTELLRFDVQTLTMSKLLKPEDWFALLPPKYGIFKLSVDDYGTRAAVNVKWFNREGEFGDVLFIDINAGTGRKLVADGQNNHFPVISPDGLHVAYYSSGPRREAQPQIAAHHHRAWVVTIDSGTAWEVAPAIFDTEVSGMPLGLKWLDNEKVISATYTTDLSFVRRHMGSHVVLKEERGSLQCPYVAVADVTTRKTKYFFLPGFGGFPATLIDRKNRLLYIHAQDDEHAVIYRTDFDLASPTIVAEHAPGDRIIRKNLSDGILSYDRVTPEAQVDTFTIAPPATDSAMPR